MILQKNRAASAANPFSHLFFLPYIACTGFYTADIALGSATRNKAEGRGSLDILDVMNTNFKGAKSTVIILKLTTSSMM